MSATRQNLTKLEEILFLVSSLLFCLMVAFGQPVNPFPVDGWFHSQYQLIGQFIGQDNYTPIAGPAILYASIHYLSSLFGFNLENEFYLGSIVHSLLLFFSGVFIYLSNRLLGIGRIGIWCSLLTVVYFGSTFLTQSFWSENLTFFLMSSVLYLVVIFYCKTNISFKIFCSLTILFGSLLGLFVITRVIPIILLPVLFLIFWFRMNRKRVVFFSLMTTFIVFLVIVTSMTANYYRFGRFELSDSTGRHLWNAISPTADVMLAESSEYQSLKNYNPSIQGKSWWDINHETFKTNHEFDKILKKLSFDAIKNEPTLFIKGGIAKLRVFLQQPPAQVGLWGSKDQSNPLHRNSFLPPLILQLEPFKKILNFSYKNISTMYRYIVFISIYVILVVAFIKILVELLNHFFLVSQSKFNSDSLPKIYGFSILAICQISLMFLGYFFQLNRSKILFYTLLLVSYCLYLVWRHINVVKATKQFYSNVNMYIPISLFFAYVFIVSLYLSLQFEEFNIRFIIPYLPILSLMTSITIQMAFIFLKSVAPVSATSQEL